MERLHQRLVNTTLSVTGWLTLTGLQRRQTPPWLWLLRLLPLTAYLLVLLGATLLLTSSPTHHQVVQGFSVYVFFLQAAVILVVFVTKRRELDTLDRQLEELGQWVACINPATQCRILARIAFFVLVAVVSCGLWVTFPMVNGNYTPGNYFFQMKFPNFLETPDSYWFCISFQMTVVILSCSLALAFDCCFFTWLNAVKFHLTKVRLAVERIGSQPSVKEAFENTEKNEQGPPNLKFIDEHWKTIWSIESSQNKEEVNKQLPKSNEENAADKQATADMDVFVGKVSEEKEKTTSGFTDPAASLRIVHQHYSQITRLVSSINQLCGLPVLVTHAAAMITVLFGLFASIALIIQPTFSGKAVYVTGYITYIFFSFLRITFYSYDGSNILEENSALVAALADMDWLDLPETARQRREALLQKASQPLCINALGVFLINKINVLNILSFVLTYLVIMLQILTSK